MSDIGTYSICLILFLNLNSLKSRTQVFTISQMEINDRFTILSLVVFVWQVIKQNHSLFNPKHRGSEDKEYETGNFLVKDENSHLTKV